MLSTHRQASRIFRGLSHKKRVGSEEKKCVAQLLKGHCDMFHKWRILGVVATVENRGFGVEAFGEVGLRRGGGGLP